MIQSLMTVKFLIDLLAKLPPQTRVFTAGTEGIHHAELGNLFPLKVCQTKFGCMLFFDDGIGDHGAVSKSWQPIDEFIHCPDGETH